jgi:hypothetical protein
MKTLVTLTVGALLIVASGCTSTVTLGAKANESQILGASAGEEGVSVTLPLLKGSVTPSTPTSPKKR